MLTVPLAPRFFLPLLLILLSFVPVYGATLHVPAEYTSIQAAIDASDVDDTILVAPGVYYENVSMREGRTLISSGGAAATIIDGEHQGSVIRCRNLYFPTLIEGFTLRHGKAELGGGLHVYASSVVFRRNIVTANTNDGIAYGAGVYTQLCSEDTRIEYNLIFGNDGNIGGGICCNGEDRSRIIGNTIWGNTANYASGIISYNHSNILVANNIIANNEGGTGMWTHSNSSTTIVCNDIWANTPSNYHGDDQTGLNGNLSLDPLFCAPGEDFRLQNDSPCIPLNHPDGADCGWMGWVELRCADPIPGACCFDGDDCIVTNRNLCEPHGGIFLGPDVPCTPSACPPTVACCLASGECFPTQPTACEAVAGTYDIGVSGCDPSPCDIPVGACCFFQGVCEVREGTDCPSSGGVFQGPGTDCDPNVCDPSSVDDSAGSGIPWSAWPNPNRGDFTVLLPSRGDLGEDVEISVHAVDGRRIFRRLESAVEPRRMQFEVRLGDQVAAGTYILRMRRGDRTVNHRLILMR